MKTCGYCGRENEDSAVACRECGLSEFSQTSAEKALKAKAQETIEPEPEMPDPEITADQEAAICPFCLFPNLPNRQWCKSCGTPFNTSVMGPFESALAEGFMWRSIVRGHPKPIVLITVWISCFPFVLFAAFAVLAALISGVMLFVPIGVIYAAIPGSLLYQVTRNFLTIPKPKLDE